MNNFVLFKNLTIAHKIWALSAMVIIGFVVVLTTFLVTENVLENAKEKAEDGKHLEYIQAKMESGSLLVRRREKDFFLRFDPKYIDAYNNDMTATIEWVKQLEEYSNMPEVAGAAITLHNIFDRHQEQFNKVSQMWTAAGLSKNDGLYADMQRDIHAIENELLVHNNEALTVKMLMMRRHEKDLMLRVATKDDAGEYANGPKYVGRLHDRQGEFLDILSTTNMSAVVKSDIETKLSNYVNSFDKYADIRIELVHETAELSKIYAETTAPFKILAENAGHISAVGQKEYDEALALTKIAVLMVIGIFGSLAAFFAVMVIRATVKPITHMKDALNKIAAGDYDCTVPCASEKDELGSMAKVIINLRDSAKERLALEKANKQEAEERSRQEQQALIDEQAEIRKKAEQEQRETLARKERSERVDVLIRAFDSDIKMDIEELKNASTSMRSTASEMVDIADSTGTQATAVSEESEKMQSNVSKMAAAIEEFTASIGETNNQVERAAMLSREAVDATTQGAKSIEQLSGATTAIEDVINMINDISEQTNLLALNATIEAARAGESGKGFAVVASEVKSLATQTGAATEDIKSQINEMQNISEAAVHSIKGIEDAINNVNSVMHEISLTISDQKTATHEISSTVQYTEQGTRKVSEEICQVSVNAGVTGTSSNDVMEMVSVLDDVSEKITRQVETFLADVKDIQQTG